jgi:hypothetical protein
MTSADEFLLEDAGFMFALPSLRDFAAGRRRQSI